MADMDDCIHQRNQMCDSPFHVLVRGELEIKKKKKKRMSKNRKKCIFKHIILKTKLNVDTNICVSTIGSKAAEVLWY